MNLGGDYLPLTGGNIRGNVNVEGNFGLLKNSTATEPEIAFELNGSHINVTNSGTEFVLQSDYVNYPLVAITKRSGNGSNSITIPTSFKADFLIYYGVFMYSICLLYTSYNDDGTSSVSNTIVFWAISTPVVLGANYIASLSWASYNFIFNYSPGVGRKELLKSYNIKMYDENDVLITSTGVKTCLLYTSM